MRLNKIIWIALVVALISFSSTYLFYTYYIIQDVQELYMKMKVGGIVGFDVNSSVLSFGIVPVGGFGERPVTLKNLHEKPLEVHIKKSGKMAKWVYTSENNFVLHPNETKELKFTVVPSLDAEEGEYHGKVKFIFTRVI